MAKQGLIPFFIPHVGCPQQCIFCNQHRIASGQHQATPEEVQETIDRCITDDGRRHGFWEVAFYGGSFTALPAVRQEALLMPATAALRAGKIQGIRCSTRPDAITAETIERLKRFGVNTVELGVQTMNRTMLEVSKRGHTDDDVVQAVSLLRNAGIHIGIQLLPGLPGESWHSLVATAVAVGRLKPDFIRIYPVIVVEDTELADMVKRGSYTPMTTEQAVAYSAFLHTYMNAKNIPTIRIGLQATEAFDKGIGLVGGPYEPAMGEMVENFEYRQAINACIRKHYATFGDPTNIVIVYRRNYTSKVRGVGNSNRKLLEQQYRRVRWTWCEYGSRQWEKARPRFGQLFDFPVQMYIDDVAYVL